MCIPQQINTNPALINPALIEVDDFEDIPDLIYDEEYEEFIENYKKFFKMMEESSNRQKQKQQQMCLLGFVIACIVIYADILINHLL